MMVLAGVDVWVTVGVCVWVAVGVMVAVRVIVGVEVISCPDLDRHPQALNNRSVPVKTSKSLRNKCVIFQRGGNFMPSV